MCNVFILPFTKGDVKPVDSIEVYFTFDGTLGLMTFSKDTDVLVKDHKRCSNLLHGFIKDITKCPRTTRIHLINLKEVLS